MKGKKNYLSLQPEDGACAGARARARSPLPARLRQGVVTLTKKPLPIRAQGITGKEVNRFISESALTNHTHNHHLH